MLENKGVVVFYSTIRCDILNKTMPQHTSTGETRELHMHNNSTINKTRTQATDARATTTAARHTCPASLPHTLAGVPWLSLLTQRGHVNILRVRLRLGVVRMATSRHVTAADDDIALPPLPHCRTDTGPLLFTVHVSSHQHRATRYTTGGITVDDGHWHVAA